MGSPTASATKSRQPEILKVPITPEKKIAPKKKPKLTPTSAEAGLATLPEHIKKTVGEHEKKNKQQEDLIIASSKKIKAVQKETTKYWGKVGQETQEYWSKKGKEAGDEWYEVVNTPAAKMAMTVVGVGILAWGAYKVLNWVRKQGDALFEELSGWKNGLTLSSLIGITGLATWKHEEIAKFAGKFFNLSPDVLMWLNKGNLKKAIETIYSSTEPTAETKKIADKAGVDAKALELNKDENYADFIQNKKSGWQTWLEKMGQGVTGQTGNVPVTASEKQLRDYLKANPPPKNLEHGATVLQAVRLATGDTTVDKTNKENHSVVKETAENAANYLGDRLPKTAKSLTKLFGSATALDMQGVKENAGKLIENVQAEGGKAALEITRDGSFQILITAAKGTKEAFVYSYKFTQEQAYQLGEYLNDPDQPWWANTAGIIIKADSYLAGGTAAFGFTKALFTTDVSLIKAPLLIAGKTIKGATWGQVTFFKDMKHIWQHSGDWMRYQKLQHQLRRLTLGNVKHYGEVLSKEAARGKYFARRVNILSKMKKLGPIVLSDSQYEKIFWLHSKAVDEATALLKDSKILRGKITEEMIEKLGRKEIQLAKLARMRKSKALIERTTRYTEKTLKVGKKTIELSSKAFAGLKAELVKRCTGKAVQKIFAEILERTGTEKIVKLIAKRAATAGATAMTGVGTIASVGLAAWTIYDVGMMGYELYNNYDTQDELTERGKYPIKNITFDPATEAALASKIPPGADLKSVELLPEFARLARATLYIERDGSTGKEKWIFENGKVVEVEVI